jgi:hypothetical protein
VTWLALAQLSPSDSPMNYNGPVLNLGGPLISLELSSSRDNNNLFSFCNYRSKTAKKYRAHLATLLRIAFCFLTKKQEY